jgi:acyl-coenzyme A synthetase/AMP-(fatty) acid ligase
MALTAVLLIASTMALLVIALAVRLGFHQRLPLALSGAWDADDAADFAAARYGDRTIFELLEPVPWGRAEGATGPDTWSARRVRDCVASLGAGLRHATALGRFDRVVIYKDNHFDLFLFALAAARVGGIAAPANGALTPEQVGAYAGHLTARVLITDRQRHGALVAAAVLPSCLEHVVLVDGRPDDEPGEGPAWRVHAIHELLVSATTGAPAFRRGARYPLFIVHTSGTTGFPKGVIILKEGHRSSIRAALCFNLLRRSDLAFASIPYNHQVTLLYLNAALVFGARMLLASRFDAREALETIDRRRPAVYFGFPITYTQMAPHLGSYGLRSVRIWATTADASHEVHQREFLRRGRFLRDLGIPRDGALFVDGLGSSEVGLPALLRLAGPWTRRFGRRVGRPVPFFGPKVKVVDADGRPVQRGTPGRLMIRGSSMFGGYWNAHDVFFAATRDGWWFTGDVVLREKDGEYVHLDREVDVIDHERGRSYTLLVEEELLKHPAVFDVSVFAGQSARGTPVPAAAVALREGCSVEEDVLRTELNALLPERDALAYVRTIPFAKFPIGVTGKALKRVLRTELG